MRETLQNRSDKRAAAVVGRAIAARAKSADVPAVHFAKPRGAQRKRFHEFGLGTVPESMLVRGSSIQH